jgi:hypothetical protein
MSDTNDKEKDNKEEASTNAQTVKDQSGDNLPAIDALSLRKTPLSEDFYALTWCSLRKSVWEEAYVLGEKISFTNSDYNWLFINFIMFILVILMTVGILLQQAFTTMHFKFARFQIEMLRMLLVGFGQRLLNPEFKKAATKYRYALQFPEEFTHPKFAAFVSFCQMMIAAISFSCIVLFVCMSNEALPLVMHFAEMAILTEIDDWVGEMIVKEYPKESHHNDDDLDITDLNIRMPLVQKLALIRENLDLVDNMSDDGSSIMMNIAYISDVFMWSWMPMVTIPFQFTLFYLQPGLISS